MSSICVESLCCRQIVTSWLLGLNCVKKLKKKKKRCLHEVHPFLEVFHTRGSKTRVFNMLDSQEAVYFGCVGCLFFQPNRKCLFPVHDTFDLETVFSPVMLVVEVLPWGIKDDGFSVWDKCSECLSCLRYCWLYSTVSFEALHLGYRREFW